MISIETLHEERQQKNTKLFKAVGLFFAFSNEQFKSGKTPLKEGEKYVSIGHGGYLPEGNVADLRKGLDEISLWYKQEIKNNKAGEKEILYELNNHECFYTRDISDVIDFFKGTYTEAQIRKVFLKQIKK